MSEAAFRYQAEAVRAALGVITGSRPKPRPSEVDLLIGRLEGAERTLRNLAARPDLASWVLDSKDWSS